MRLYNNTQNEALYTISAGQSDSCGTIDPGKTAEDAYNNTQNVTVYFSNNDNSYPFSVTIPNTGTGMAVTVGIYFE